MSDEVKRKKYGTHRRISDTNLERIKNVGRMGDSVNTAIGKLLDQVEDINRCLEGKEPRTDEIKKLMRKLITKKQATEQTADNSFKCEKCAYYDPDNHRIDDRTFEGLCGYYEVDILDLWDNGINVLKCKSFKENGD